MQAANDPASQKWSAVDLAFSKQAIHFDSDDRINSILQAWRKQIYLHVGMFLKPGARILELNAGTGIDALFFASRGHSVVATDLSAGMMEQVRSKIEQHPHLDISSRQVSFQNLDRLNSGKFDYVFSNFGGLNCIRDLSIITRNIASQLNQKAYITCVIMPPFCPWEFLWILKGKWREAFRRFRSDGTPANLEGETFQTYYHSLSDLQEALGNSFVKVRSEGLGIFSAPPAAINFLKKNKVLYRTLRKLDLMIMNYYPFNRWGDHIIATFQKK
jgi:Methyltransferase domain